MVRYVLYVTLCHLPTHRPDLRYKQNIIRRTTRIRNVAVPLMGRVDRCHDAAATMSASQYDWQERLLTRVKYSQIIMNVC